MYLNFQYIRCITSTARDIDIFFEYTFLLTLTSFTTIKSLFLIKRIIGVNYLVENFNKGYIHYYFDHFFEITYLS